MRCPKDGAEGETFHLGSNYITICIFCHDIIHNSFDNPEVDNETNMEGGTQEKKEIKKRQPLSET